jgi:hypothetical protein
MSGTRYLYGVRGSCHLLGSSPMIYDDGICLVDSSCGPVMSGDPHIPPSMWRDHGDAARHHHDPWSSHRWHSGLWTGVSRQVEGLRWGSYRHLTPPPPPTFPHTRRTRSHRASTLGGSQLTLTPARRVSRTLLFRGMLGLIFGIWMMNDCFLI